MTEFNEIATRLKSTACVRQPLPYMDTLTVCRRKASLIAGVAADPTLEGIRVEVKGNRVMIVVGVPFADKLSPATFEVRKNEMKAALDLATAKKAGIIRMK